MEDVLFRNSAAASEGSFLKGAGISTTQELEELLTLDKRLEGLVLSSQRLGVDKRDAASWSALLGDFSAFTASCALANSAVLPKMFTRSVVPCHLPLDVNVYSKVAELLATKPDEEVTYELNKLKDAQLRIDSNPLGDELIQRRVKGQNGVLESAALLLLNETATEQWKKPRDQTNHTTQYFREKQAERIRKAVAAIYNGTSREHF